ncbi:protein phosphatase 2C, related [Neospora caninum Liverpool]|uniref:Protein phosphatase n=1 Tax=Neospora caninum (strain Liverpool) TaxID=572307 RepID=F0V9H6_NEOCL|nr:protein phosphatase 2C, related [Neospora caninum Liverpool]CBZ50401.1 protein phosphatase 2C, related [Neospora caninum Liverpool]CEL65009.1 TPA: Protein phosphatase 2C, related [Neospora caninum Liverpool]|eukprot:XP_003880435.1 protein phosphatase 2C, related [Neospora caninum Liverpool]
MATIRAAAAPACGSATGALFRRSRSALGKGRVVPDTLQAAASLSFLATPLLATRRLPTLSSLSSLASLPALELGQSGAACNPRHRPGVRTPQLHAESQVPARPLWQLQVLAHLSSSPLRASAPLRRGFVSPASRLSASSLEPRHPARLTSAAGSSGRRGASVHGSSQTLQRRFISFDAHCVQIPHPSKREKGGEDAASCSDRFLVVADGVGGWESSGIDAGLYARELVHRLRLIFDECMRESKQQRGSLASSPSSPSSESSPPSPLSPTLSPQASCAESRARDGSGQSDPQGERTAEREATEAAESEDDAEPESAPDPVKLLKAAYLSTRAIGSSTCCLVLLDSLQRRVLAANLGDSGFLLYRPSEDRVVARSAFQCHDFNFPLQLGTGSSDMPEHAHVLDVPVVEGDILFLATDGVWDNLYDNQVLDVLRKQPDVRKAAEEIADLAFKHSQDPRWASPFSTKEREVLGLTRRHLGGKPDDISVVLASVVGKRRQTASSQERQ